VFLVNIYCGKSFTYFRCDSYIAESVPNYKLLILKYLINYEGAENQQSVKKQKNF